MKPSLDKLIKFFKLEADRGYDNRAVVGGLDRMLSLWEAEARAENLPDDLVQLVTSHLRNYPTLSPRSRAESLDGIWKRISREGSGPPPPSLPPAPEPPKVETLPSPPRTRTKAPAPARSLQANKRPAGVGSPKLSPIVEGASAAMSAPTTVLQGVGPRHASTLTRLGIFTLGDMLYFFPRRYLDYSQLKPINRLWYGEEVTVIAMVESAVARPIRRGRFQIVEAIVSDSSGSLRINWFNQPWIAKKLTPGLYISISGKIDQYQGRLVMNNPEIEMMDQQNLSTNRIAPVYPLTANITQRWLRSLMHQVVSYWGPRVQDPVPASTREDAHLMDLSSALMQAHFPDSQEQLELARRRLAFDEIFLLQLGVLRQKSTWQERTARVFGIEDDWLQTQLARLPYQLTNAQQRALSDLRSDLNSGHPMNRLLQGDVGSGKTIIAALGMSMIVSQGAQAALMAPTSILAEQHYKNISQLLCAATQLEDGSSIDPLLAPEQIQLLLGATTEAEKEEIKQKLSAGTIKIIIGTHALIEDPIIFQDLQMVVVDEQHRFGVEQRSALRVKGNNPHLLVMTATPIPRSLALTVYGDLDLTVIDELPPGRQSIETQVYFPHERERSYAMIRGQVQQGCQAFIIYPLVEESENNPALGAVEEYERLQSQIFPDLKLGLLHGRMKPEEKEAIMTQFRDGLIHVLVSTSVVEVGVDIPNATVMMVEAANRFGLAQLHQFRGRVGRGKAKSYCILVAENADTAENERLSAMVETNDGFILAERDLDQRGPGDFLGTRQSGYHSELRMASLTDVRLIETARKQAQQIFVHDPDLTAESHQLLVTALNSFWQTGQGDVS